ncbi:MAG TPA: hypothetical protein VM577_14810 [Anaerovoracaceae bacterium]|nr:hypothetical protein [Anaerovoracaceae bacterium]
MFSWNLDNEIKDLEKTLEVYGHFEISAYRITMARDRMKVFGLTPLSYQCSGASYPVWVVSLGSELMPNPFYYGHTVRDAWLKAKEAALQLVKGSKNYSHLTGLAAVISFLTEPTT